MESKRRLMAVNGYNYRLSQKSGAEKAEIAIKDIKAELMFDRMTGQVYHDKIVHYAYSKLLYAAKHDKETAKKAFRELKKDLKIKTKYSLKKALRLMAVLYFCRLHK